MTKKTASVEMMEAVHMLTAASLIEQLQPRTIEHAALYDKDGNETKAAWTETIYPSPAVISAAAKFLKDNSVFSTPGQSATMDEMRKRVADRAAARKLTPEDRKDALAGFGAKMVQ